MEIIARGLLVVLVAFAVIHGVNSWAPSFKNTMGTISGALSGHAPTLTVVDNGR